MRKIGTHFLMRPGTVAGALIAALLLLPAQAARQGPVGGAPAQQSVSSRSCHNPLRDGRLSLAPAAAFELSLPMRDWQALRGELERFAATRRWSFYANVQPDAKYPWFQASLCTEPGTLIFATNSIEKGYIHIAALQPQGGDGWQAPLHALQRQLETRWPGRISYRYDPLAPPPPPWAPPSPTPTAQAR